MKLGKVTALLLTTLTSFVLVACGTGEATVTAELAMEGPDGEMVTRPLGDLVVQLIPYDRDALFDSLGQAYGSPEPEFPADILAAQAEVTTAQQEWRDTETRWGNLRDTLQVLNTALERLNPGEGQYRVLFRDWQDLDADYSSLDRQVKRSFDRFQELSAATITRVDSVQVLRNEWADEAFADVSVAIGAKLEASGLTVATDTTDAAGIAAMELDPGTYWVFARHELPYNELYWNLPITLVKGEPLSIRLSRDNAEVRTIY